MNNAFHDGNRKAFLDAPLEEWRQTMDVNFWGTLQMTRAAVPAMIERGGGRVVMVNTMSAHRIEPHLRRLRRVEGRAGDRHQDPRRSSSARTASG